MYEDKCVGYIGFWKIVEEAHITNLSVHPNFQNKKLAQKLLLSMIDECYKEKIKFINNFINTITKIINFLMATTFARKIFI